MSARPTLFRPHGPNRIDSDPIRLRDASRPHAPPPSQVPEVGTVHSGANSRGPRSLNPSPPSSVRRRPAAIGGVGALGSQGGQDAADAFRSKAPARFLRGGDSADAPRGPEPAPAADAPAARRGGNVCSPGWRRAAQPEVSPHGTGGPGDRRRRGGACGLEASGPPAFMARFMRVDAPAGRASVASGGGLRGAGRRGEGLLRAQSAGGDLGRGAPGARAAGLASPNGGD